RLVAAVGELLDPLAHVALELPEVALPIEVAVGLDVADVVVEGELHVHVTDLPAGQQEREVGDAALTVARLFAVVDVLDEPGRPQHILGHALAPLASALGSCQRLSQALGGLGEGGGLLAGGPQLAGEVAELGLTVTLELVDEGPDLLER